MRAFKISFLVTIIQITVFSQNFWQETNGPYGGTIYTVQYPSGDSILAGTDNGIYVTSDLGENWYSSDKRLKFKSILDIEKFQDGYLFIIDEAALVKTTASSYDTIYFTNDRPRTVAVNNSGEIFLGTDYNIYSSTDSGSSWISLEDSTMNINYSQDIIFKNDTIIFYSEGNQIHRSYDDGFTWVKINDSFQYAPVSTIYLDAESNLYAAAGFGELFKSVDNGDTWENIADGYYITALTRDSSDFYAGTIEGIYISTDGGYSWFNYSDGLISKSIHCLSNYAGKIIAGTYGGGAYVLNEDTNAWESKTAGMDATEIMDIIIDSENNVLAGTKGTGIQRELNNGLLIWELANNGLNDNVIRSLAISKYENSYDDIYCGTRFGVFKTTDQGQNWVDMNSPCYNDAYGICVNNTGSVFIYSYCGVFRTTDDGNSWDLMNSNNWNNVLYIASDPDQANVYVSDVYDFYRTTDNGASWIVSYFTGGSALRIGINGKGYIYVLSVYGELLRSKNSGNTFQNINNGLPAEYTFMHDIAFNSEDDIFLATLNGLYMSKDDGDSWYLVDESNISKNINILYFNNEDRLYAGTIRSGVFRSVNLLTNLEETPVNTKNYSLSQNYPNPFNSSTIIRYSVPQTAQVQIKVYDILGEEAAILVNEIKQTGQYEVEFNAGRLTSGIYFYRIQAGSFIETRKMILLK